MNFILDILLLGSGFGAGILFTNIKIGYQIETYLGIVDRKLDSIIDRVHK